jgi:hypothetical protein
MLMTDTDTTQQGNEMVTLFKAWLESSRQMWQDMESGSKKTNNGHPFAFSFAADEEEGSEKYKTYRTWETSVNSYLSFIKLMTAPGNQQSFLKGTNNYFEAMVEAVGDSMENLTEFQSQLIKSFATVGEHTKAYNFDDLDHDSFESFRDLYRTEFQKYFNIPKIGLPREFHEQLSTLVDKSNIYASHLIELIYLFSIPFEKTNRVMQCKLKNMLEEGKFPEDYKQGYTEWIKILEGHYMELLKSQEYTHVLNDFIGSLAAYKSVKNEVIGTFIKDLQIPTNKEMDEVYRDIYTMKGKIKELTRQIETLQHELNAQ